MAYVSDALREREAAALHARQAAEDRGALGQRVRFNARRREAAPKARVWATDPNRDPMNDYIRWAPVTDWPLKLDQIGVWATDGSIPA